MSVSFVVDAMLGSLAKWLRILGYDAVFDPALGDHQLVRLARAEGRILLSRDRELVRRRGVHTLFVHSEDLEDQLRQVLADLHLTPNLPGSRCPVCNGQLQELAREAARARVPAYVAETQEMFRHCPDCRRVYWRGTHWQEMSQKLTELWPEATDPAPSDESEP